jgi:hypothetical protein
MQFEQENEPYPVVPIALAIAFYGIQQFFQQFVFFGGVGRCCCQD